LIAHYNVGGLSPFRDKQNSFLGKLGFWVSNAAEAWHFRGSRRQMPPAFKAGAEDAAGSSASLDPRITNLGDNVENVVSMLPTNIEHHPRAVRLLRRGWLDQVMAM